MFYLMAGSASHNIASQIIYGSMMISISFLVIGPIIMLFALSKRYSFLIYSIPYSALIVAFIYDMLNLTSNKFFPSIKELSLSILDISIMFSFVVGFMVSLMFGILTLVVIFGSWVDFKKKMEFENR
jgi:hypothetical protein